MDPPSSGPVAKWELTWFGGGPPTVPPLATGNWKRVEANDDGAALPVQREKVLGRILTALAGVLKTLRAWGSGVYGPPGPSVTV